MDVVKEKNLVWSFLAIFSIFLVSLNNTLISVSILGITIDRLLEMFLFLILLPFIFKELINNDSFFIFMVIILIMIFFRTVILFLDASTGTTELESILRDIVRIVMFAIFFSLAYFGLLKLGSKGIALFIFLTSPYFLLAFMQHPITPLTEVGAIITENLYLGNMIQDSTNKGGYIYTEFKRLGHMIRPSGPYGSPIILSYSIIPVMALSLFMYIYEEKKIYYFWFLFLSVVAFLSLTRSLIVGTFLMLLCITLIQFILRRDRWMPAVLTLLSIPIFIFVSDQIEFFNRIFSFSDVFGGEDLSVRQVAWISGFMALMENPIYFISEDYLEIFQSMCLQNTNCIDFVSMHNGFLRVGRDFGLLGLILYLALFSWIFFKCFKQLFPYNLLFGICFIAYLTNTMFHNNTLFISEYSVLILIALLFLFDKRESLNAQRIN
tara:strand:+ start:22775 stop:24082 length:1308 start_codon:yes stop_codon:yes gene_type:complete